MQELSPGDDTLTYTQLAAGVDAQLNGRNTGGSLSLRYERNIAWGNDSVDTDTLTGIARGYTAIVPRTLTLEAGALASSTRIDGSGGASFNPVDRDGTDSQIYSVYAGPNLTERVGDADITGTYRLGYTRIESDAAVTLAPGVDRLDVFDDSVTHDAKLRVATRPGEPLPVGLAVEGGYFQEDVSNLDQRVRDAYLRGEVTVPVTPTVALVGAVGYEDVEVSSRDALRTADGAPIVGADGRFVTDENAPRTLAYDVSGVIWDVGAIWRPSRRTALEAHVGRRYDSTTYYGNFTWQPDRRTNIGVSVYDSIDGFGGPADECAGRIAGHLRSRGKAWLCGWRLQRLRDRCRR